MDLLYELTVEYRWETFDIEAIIEAIVPHLEELVCEAAEAWVQVKAWKRIDDDYWGWLIPPEWEQCGLCPASDPSPDTGADGSQVER